ncbi:HPP family protein [Paenibacillus sp. 1011MAR3C5]|uniref:HPP family protein n=1 Tax=Paenibacillus sp. 1011MAR3C5 TaxID=1675787 RepID=UPI0015FF4501|nr:HPP family protein [Paenibacillus sp. 1011MAR3C5]
MQLKTYAICSYILFIYWVSSHIPQMHSLFFPTLGAFSLLFISRPLNHTELRNIAVGAITASAIGSLFVHLSTGILSLLATLLIVLGLMKKLNWNAPPILAVALIPFFTQPPSVWIIPVSVACTLAGLLVILSAAAFAEKLIGSKPAVIKADSDTAA